ncbi:hypothetical protein BDW68DRAFT_136839 [Aspergillus falconensis]
MRNKRKASLTQHGKFRHTSSPDKRKNRGNRYIVTSSDEEDIRTDEGEVTADEDWEIKGILAETESHYLIDWVGHYSPSWVGSVYNLLAWCRHEEPSNELVSTRNQNKTPTRLRFRSGKKRKGKNKLLLRETAPRLSNLQRGHLILTGTSVLRPLHKNLYGNSPLTPICSFRLTLYRRGILERPTNAHCRA